MTTRWERFRDQTATLPVFMILGLFLAIAAQSFGVVNAYVQLILITIGINVILATSLNLVNGMMGEFSVGHAGFMAVGAYTASILTVKVLPVAAVPWLFPFAVVAGGAAAALVGLGLSVLSFKTRGDYLAIVTLAFGAIVKSVLENLDSVGGARGFLGMQKVTTVPWAFLFAAATVICIRNLVYSSLGRGVLAIREDELAANLSGVNTRKAKVLAFVVSSFFAGIAGGLYAHLLQFVNPRMFDLVKSTDILVMVYLGGIGSLFGSILGATVFTVLLEVLRPFGMLRMIVMPLTLVLLMIFRPRGIAGTLEVSWLVPLRERLLKVGLRGGKEQRLPLLLVDGVTQLFGGLCALSDFRLRVEPGELVAVIGPNGAGKTTVFNVITGIYRPSRGEIHFDGAPITGLPASAIAARGIARTFQNIRLFKELSALDNVRVAHASEAATTALDALVSTKRFRDEEKRITQRSLDLLALLGLERFALEPAGSLPYGSQRRLEIARALALRPKLLLLDEPAAGMNNAETMELVELVRFVKKQFALTIVLIEHQMDLVMGLAERILVLDFGVTIAEGRPDEIRTNPKVLESYLGAPAA